MISKILRKAGLVSILAGVALAQEPTAQPKRYDVNALGKVYEYKTKEEADLATKTIQGAMEIQERHGTKPYVWGGEGFESLEEQKKLYGKSVTDKQPSGSWRAGQPTAPGVDCSGLIFQLQRAMQFSYSRLTADGYAKKTKIIIQETKDLKEIIEKALPGDLIFFMDKGKAVHVAWYLGNGHVIESVGTRDSIEKIQKEALEEWRKYAQPRKHNKLDLDYGGIQLADLKKKELRYAVQIGRFKEFIPPEKKQKK